MYVSIVCCQVLVVYCQYCMIVGSIAGPLEGQSLVVDGIVLLSLVLMT